jgi:diaminopimelate decarboxylase
MVDDAGSLITTVVAVKRGHRDTPAGVSSAIDPKGLVPSASGGELRPGVIVDAGVHMLYTAPWFRLEVLPVRPPLGPPGDVRLFGCLCMNIDVIRESVALPPSAAGDLLIIRPVGAYTITQSMQFINYRPRVVMIDPQGVDHVIRERENLEYVEAMDRMPSHLGASA